MKRVAIAAAALAISLLTYFQFPGHTWLQQDSQIYAPVLENRYDHAILRNDILAQQSHLAYTIYDDVALPFRRFTPFSYREILAAQQVLARAIGIWGLFLIAQALGLASAPAATVALIVSLGAAIAGPAVLTTEYEPTPRAVALPLIYAAIGLTAHRRFAPAALLAAVATLYQFPAALPFWLLFAVILLRKYRAAAVVPLLVLPLTLTPLQEQLQRMRTAYVWVSTWPAATILHHVLVAAIAGAAFYRIRHKVSTELRILLLGLAAIGLLSMPLSWILLEQFKLAIAPQLQPLRWLLGATLAMQLLAAAAAAHSPRRVEAAVWFALAFWPAVAPLSWRRVAVIAGLAIAAALAKRFAPIVALAAFAAIPVLGGVVNYPHLHTPELSELSRWARLNTDRDAVFLFADSGRSLLPGIFRSEARRAVYVDWKAGGQVNYLPEFAEQWWSRWQETAGNAFKPEDLPKYPALGIAYIVLQPRNRLARPPDFENAKWLVYRVAN
jgi:hypothetical protein